MHQPRLPLFACTEEADLMVRLPSALYPGLGISNGEWELCWAVRVLDRANSRPVSDGEAAPPWNPHSPTSSLPCGMKPTDLYPFLWDELAWRPCALTRSSNFSTFAA